MKHTTSESDVTSLATTSPPKTPKRAAYYVQSPSRDSHDDGDTSHTTPVYNSSPLDSPSHPSTGRHSRISSATRYSGFLRSSSSPPPGSSRAGRKRLFNSIDEEAGGYEKVEERRQEKRAKLCAAAFWLSVLLLLFTVVCLIVWGAARHCKPSIIVKSLRVHSFYVGEGTDRTGVPTKLVTLNCSLHVNVHNPSTMFGIHVSSSSSRLLYSEISIANGQFDNSFYQPRTSHRVATMVLHGDRTPLYGAGATLDVSNTGGTAVPLTLELAVTTKGYVIGQLVRVSHAEHAKCPVVIESGSSKPVSFRQNACSYA